MNSSTPNNINAAIKQANRRERALNILKEGYKFEDMGEGVIAVTKPGTTAAAYWLNMITPGCDCPDAMKGNNCKHEIAWEILQDEAKMWDAACAEYDARIEADDVPYLYAEH
jgi:hypothetical protein